MSREQTAVVLFNLGGPDDLASVEPFLINLFSDREIIELPCGAALQPVFARVIAKLRGPSVRRNYARIGGGSPQLRITMAQAAALEDRLNAAIPDAYRVFVAMRYSRPTCEDTMAAIVSEGIRRIVTLTLFPQYSKATTGSSRREFDRLVARPAWDALGFHITHVDRYADHAGYLDAMAERVMEAWHRIPGPSRENAVLLFSAHGLPQRFIDAGDPYVQEIEATRRGILARVQLPCRNVLAYQSRTGPVKWIGPGTEEMLETLGREGVRDVLVVPLSFVSDHIETLYEVDLLFGEVAARAGITGYYRTDALNTSPRFIGALADLVRAQTGDRSCGCDGCGGCDTGRQALTLAAV
jgi:ferrochelatase